MGLEEERLEEERLEEEIGKKNATSRWWKQKVKWENKRALNKERLKKMEQRKNISELKKKRKRKTETDEWIKGQEARKWNKVRRNETQRRGLNETKRRKKTTAKVL